MNIVCFIYFFVCYSNFYFRNPSAGSLASETGSLDRMKAAAERRKKGLDDSGTTVSERVEGTRVNPDSLIDELIKNTKLDQLEESEYSIPVSHLHKEHHFTKMTRCPLQPLDLNIFPYKSKRQYVSVLFYVFLL